MKKILLSIAICMVAVQASQAQRLIVRMDDLGVTHATNLAIIKCYEEGIGRSAEVMSVCPWFMEAANMLKEYPGLDVGVHITLCCEWAGFKWRPLTDCPSLCDEDGYLIGKTQNPNATLEDVEKEMRAQIELAMKYIDNVTHITDHCMWTMRPEFKELAIRVAEEYGLRYQGQGDYDAEIGIESLPMGFGGGNRAPRLLDAIKKMEKGKTYWTIEHPSLDNEEMRGIYEVTARGEKRYAGPDRQDVTNAFTDPEIMQYIKENGIELVSFGDVMREKGVIE
ncbi:MAG: ChbG/HpnK family deacetylase [Tidjanibacter sp.]|nr:ChbG/HpnK family deacetylase [Tidjanibacter sp.]